MKKIFFSLLGISFMAGQLAYTSTKPQTDGYMLEIKDANSKEIKEMVKNGQMELIKTSFGTFGYVSESKISAVKANTVSTLFGDSPIVSVEPNVVYRPLEMETPQDPFFKSQWGFRNTGKNNWVKGPEGEDVHALEAWQITKGSHDIIIAVIDSGAKIDHPDLQENIYTNMAEKNGITGVDDDGNGYIDDIHGWDFANNDNNPDDELGHGTHVAGLIGASHNNIGIAGMMANVQIMPLKFLTKERKGDTKNAVMAIDYAIKMGAKIINNSWGSENSSEILQKAIQAANDNGIIFVASAGNSKNDNEAKPMFPSSYKIPNIIAVGATNGLGDKASFSNYGKSLVHVFAPGIYIVSLTPDDQDTYKTGTSMSAPIVSGALGLLLTQFPGMDVQTAKTRLMETTDNKEKFSEFGLAGRLNTYRLLTGK
ncbi:MAG: S8 family peptidase [Bdellovibrio sp.]